MDHFRGQVIKGYELYEQIGAGGWGRVYRAAQPGIGRDVAIKIIDPTFANQPDFIRRFEAEAQLVARLEHPYIVPLYDYWRDPSGAYLVMRYLHDGSLHAALLRGGPVPLATAVRLLEQIGAALSTAHRQGVIHRDVKPANVLLDADHNAYLADFGIATDLYEDAALLLPAGPGGSGDAAAPGSPATGAPGPLDIASTFPAYQAPEQIKGDLVSPQTDIYSLGLLLYEVLTGVPPFPGPTPADLRHQQLHSLLPALGVSRPELPPELAAVLARATAKDPAARYPDVPSLIAAFRQAAGVTARSEEDLRRLPTGTVTFLFTDIEGSTGRWEHHPAEMQIAISRHDAILRQTIAAHEGRVFETAGDSFLAAFSSAGMALTTALDAQRALRAATWPDAVAPLRVRMALGSGPAELRDGSYHAQYTLNRLARLMAVGHGGQVLVTDQAREMLSADLPPGVGLRALGAHQLKDLREPLAVFQVVAPEAPWTLPTDFPPLRTLDGPTAEMATPGSLALAEETGAEIENPYKGLRAFQEADAAEFFGREVLVGRLLAHLAGPGTGARFLGVVGPSGSGKSSVVHAGLLPALRQDALPGASCWFIVTMTPGAHPQAELEAALLRVAAGPLAGLRAQLAAGDGGLERAVGAILPAAAETELLLVIDQFEELFTLVEDEGERHHFLSSLCRAVSAAGSRLRVIITLRADFYDRPLLYPDLSELLRGHTEVVGPLTPGELRQAIAAPAARVGITLEHDLLEVIGQEAGSQPGTLPLVQYALTELFARREGRRLTLAAYRASGGVLGALAGRAEEIYTGLAEPEQALARQLFLRLVTLGEGTEDTRRRVHYRELESLAHAAGAVSPGPAAGITHPRSLDHVLAEFGRYRLLTFDHDPITREPTVEVAHEALLRSWARLREWLDGGRADLRVQRQLGTAAGEWERAGQDRSFLAGGARLAQFAALVAEGQVALTAGERAYLDASLAEQARQAAAEQTRQDHELALAHRAVRAQRSAAMRLRVLVGVLAGFSLIAIALSVFAFNQGQVAQSSFTHAEAQRLAAEANALLQGRANAPAPMIALLAIRSMSTLYTPQGDAALEGAAVLAYPRRMFSGHSGVVNAVAFAPDGKTMVTGSADTTVRLWDVATGAEIRRFTGITDTVYAVAFAPDGKTVLAGGYDHTARLWDVATGAELRRFAGPEKVAAVAFSPDGKWVLTGSADGVARLWDAGTGALVRQFAGMSGFVFGAAISPDGRWVLTAASSDHAAHLWDAATGAEIRRFGDHTGTVIQVAFAPDGQTVLTGSLDNTACLWETATGRQVRCLTGHTGGVKALAFAPDGQTILTTSDDGTARLWDTATGTQIQKLAGHTGGVPAGAFAPDGQTVLTGGNDGTALLWDAGPRPGIAVFRGHTGAINVQGVAFSPDGKTVLTGSADKTARLWDAATGAPVRTFRGHTDPITSVAFAPDGKTVLTAGDDKTARLWDVATGAELRRFTRPEGIGHAAFSPDGRYIFTGGYKVADLWDTGTGAAVRTFPGLSDVLWCVAYAPSGRWVAGGGAENLGQIWDAQTGALIQTLRGHTGWVTGVAFSPDSKWVVTSSTDKTARLWDAASGALVRTFAGQADESWGVAFAPDGKTVLTAGNDKTARLWDVQTGAELRRFAGHTDKVLAVAYAPDGKTVLTGSADTTARVWFVDYHDTLQALCSRLLRDLSPAERAVYNIRDQTPTCPEP